MAATAGQIAGQKIQELRRGRGFTRKEMARRLGMDYQHYLELEKEGAGLHGEVVGKLARLLEVQAEEIGGGEMPSGEGRPGDMEGALGRLLVREKALLRLLIDKGVVGEEEFKEAYRLGNKGTEE